MDRRATRPWHVVQVGRGEPATVRGAIAIWQVLHAEPGHHAGLHCKARALGRRWPRSELRHAGSALVVARALALALAVGLPALDVQATLDRGGGRAGGLASA